MFTYSQLFILFNRFHFAVRLFCYKSHDVKMWLEQKSGKRAGDKLVTDVVTTF